MKISEEFNDWIKKEINKVQEESFNAGYITCAKCIIAFLSSYPEEGFSKEKILTLMNIVLNKGA